MYSVGTYSQIHFPKHQFLLQFEMPQAFPFDIQITESYKNLSWKDRTLFPEYFNSLCCHKHNSWWSGFPGTCQVKLWKAQRPEISLPFWDCLVVLHHCDWFCLIFFFFGLFYLNLINCFCLFRHTPLKIASISSITLFRWSQTAAKHLLNILFPRLIKLLPSVCCVVPPFCHLVTPCWTVHFVLLVVGSAKLDTVMLM